jgi:uncharacterized membrane protein YjgN (DUF898 family)
VKERSQAFSFDGGAGTFLGTAILAALITVFSLGIAYPFALVPMQRWKAKHTYVYGRRLIFLGTGVGLFGLWIKWFLLMIVTLGIYGFWVAPQVQKWIVVNTDFDPSFPPQPTYGPPATYGPPPTYAPPTQFG